MEHRCEKLNYLLAEEKKQSTHIMTPSNGTIPASFFSTIKYSEKDGFLQILINLNSSMRIVYHEINAVLYSRKAVVKYFQTFEEQLMIVALVNNATEYSQIRLASNLVDIYKSVHTTNCGQIELDCAYVFHQQQIHDKIVPSCILFELKTTDNKK
jgi:hypothetical protein